MENPEITLYDLACAKQEPFSPVVWRIRLMLNYKQIPYRTIFLEFQDIEPTLKALYVCTNNDLIIIHIEPRICDLSAISAILKSLLISDPVVASCPERQPEADTQSQ